MNKQLFIGDKKPSRNLLKPIKNRPGINYKPFGGLWTSSYDAKTGSAWVDWCKHEMPHWLETSAWKLTPLETANVYTIDTLQDLEMLYNMAPHFLDLGFSCVCRLIDWETAAHTYDAIHFTENGAYCNRYSFFGELPSTYLIDCESTIWFRWCFEDVRQTNLKHF